MLFLWKWCYLVSILQYEIKEKIKEHQSFKQVFIKWTIFSASVYVCRVELCLQHTGQEHIREEAVRWTDCDHMGTRTRERENPKIICIYIYLKKKRAGSKKKTKNKRNRRKSRWVWRQPCCGGFICVVYLVGGDAVRWQRQLLPWCRQGVPGMRHFCRERAGFHGSGLGPRRETASTCWGYCEISQ